jgi:hypothetical protein
MLDGSGSINGMVNVLISCVRLALVSTEPVALPLPRALPVALSVLCVLPLKEQGGELVSLTSARGLPLV